MGESCSIDADKYNEVDDPMRKSYKITFNNKSKFWSATTLVPKTFMGKFIGTQSLNKKKIEKSNECTIEVPQSKKHGPITIKSTTSAEKVERCLDQIEMFVAVQRLKAAPTHFVSLALQSDELLKNYNGFCLLVKNSSAVPDESKMPKLFMPPVRLHLTLCMLALLSEQDVEKASKALTNIVETEVRPLLKDRPLIVNVKGLSHFGDEDPSETRVLFAKVSGIKLLEIAEIINRKMLATGLAKIGNRDLKLHMTILNSKYAMRAGADNNTFDANAIMRDFSDYDFGAADVNEVKICALNIDTTTGNYCTAHSVQFIV